MTLPGHVEVIMLTCGYDLNIAFYKFIFVLKFDITSSVKKQSSHILFVVNCYSSERVRVVFLEAYSDNTNQITDNEFIYKLKQHPGCIVQMYGCVQEVIKEQNCYNSVCVVFLALIFEISRTHVRV